jgi:hypothetical protein
MALPLANPSATHGQGLAQGGHIFVSAGLIEIILCKFLGGSIEKRQNT